VNLPPVVKYMVLCEDARLEGPPPGQLNIEALTYRLKSGSGRFPSYIPKLCALVVLSNGRGQGIGEVIGIHEDADRTFYRSGPQELDLGDDPLEFRVAFFHMKNVVIPAAGAYTFEFRYNGEVLATQALVVRSGRS
jgi:hypothetical protein